MTDHNCRGCKHIVNNSSEEPCLHCKRVHRPDKYEVRQPKTETWYQLIRSFHTPHYNEHGNTLKWRKGVIREWFWFDDVEVALIE